MVRLMMNVWMWMKKVELLLFNNLYNVGFDRGMGILLFVSDFENHQIQVMEYEGNFI